ncbi:MAG: TrmH family RNA methyltransferase [Pseudomonadota bacterium]
MQKPKPKLTLSKAKPNPWAGTSKRPSKERPKAKTPAKERPEPKAPAKERREIKYHGTAACLALWQQRPDDVIRIYLEEANIPKFAAMLKWAAEQRKAYHVVTREDLERLTETEHHQGICLLAREKPSVTFMAMLQKLRREARPHQLIYLDGVENPHNLGAILRSCAHFGVPYVLGAGGRLPQLSPSACRIAEGAAEHVDLVYLNEPHAQLVALKKAGYEIIATRAREADPVYQHRFKPRSVLVLGAEVEGVSARLLNEADAVLGIPGSGVMDSLNVSVAGAILMSEFFRRHRT